MPFLSAFAPDLVGYTRDKFKGDLAAGVVTGIVAIPLSLGLAIATGVPPVLGLYTAVVAGFVAAFFAGSRYSVSGPAAAMIPILAPIIATYGLGSIPTIGILAGIFLLVFGLLKFGNLIRYVPPAVTYGFTAGIAIVIFAGQLNNFFGLSGLPSGEHFHEKLWITLTHLPVLSIPTVIIGVISLVILIGLPYVPRLGKIPASLVAVTVATLLAMYAPYFSGVANIADAFGAIALGLPAFVIPHVGDIPTLIIPALKIALLITVESLLCAVVADKMTRTRHLSNRELIAQGLANLASPFFGGIPATAVIARTGTSIKSGAETRIAPIIHAIVVALFLAVAAPLGSQIPITTLAAILFITAWKISEADHIRHLIHTAPRADLVVLAVTLILTVFLDLTVSVSIGLAASALIIFKKLSTVYAEEVTATSNFVNETVRQALVAHPEVQFINLEGNLSMGFGSTLIDAFSIKKTTKRVIIRLRDVQHIDLSGLEALDELVTELGRQGREVHLTSANVTLARELTRFGIAKKIGHLYGTTTDAIRALYPDRERRARDAGAPMGSDRRKK